ncbi:pyrroline-5-carboxylate reductase [Bacillus gobiensis]|uniref:pyrroline-5-carboxylate reductase n=1 Tax=Bacillus gobiensis TaxID=1441095 RepID=UPI003D1DF142
MNKIGFIGAGSMAESMINGMVNSKIINPKNIYVTNHSNIDRLHELNNTYGITICTDKKQLMQETDIVVLAMKPKDAASGIQNIRSFLNDHLIISVLAGITIDTIQLLFNEQVSVVRAMPNTSASIQKSATAFTVCEHVTEKQFNHAQAFLETIGEAFYVDENEMDAITAVSGSGPAYIYHFIEALEAAAIEVGLSQSTAKHLIFQTLSGATEMLLQSEKSPGILKKEITSPGGTTEAGLKTLQRYHFSEAVTECVRNAARRSAEIKVEFSKQALKNQA